MASAKRTQELRASLVRQLEAVSSRDGANSRLLWLHAELENQLDRWLAFAAIDGIPLESLLRDDLFAMIGVVNEVLDAEIRERRLEEWRIIQTALKGIGTVKNRAELARVREALTVVGARLKAA